MHRLAAAKRMAKTVEEAVAQLFSAVEKAVCGRRRKGAVTKLLHAVGKAFYGRKRPGLFSFTFAAVKEAARCLVKLKE